MMAQTKYIFITGGVVSSLGKGIAAASIGALLESRGLSVSLIKVDPYINVDPGTMSPFQHGEVFVTNDGTETDLDLGHYERFVRFQASKKNNFTDCLFVTEGKLKSDMDITYRKSGCAALNLAYVAAGRYDGYFQKNLNIWDIAAGIILINEAGGIINKIDLTAIKDIKLIASNADISSKLIKKLGNF